MIDVTVKYVGYEPVAGFIVKNNTGDYVCIYPVPWGDRKATYRYLKKNDGTQPWESNIDDLIIEVGHDL